MKFGLRVPACRSAVEVADFIARVEQAGFDYAWVPDTQLLSRDVWATLALAAARTSTLGLGPAVTNPITRDATVTACAAATIEELAPGRFALGIGSGHSSVRVMGLKTARLAQLRDYIELMRPLWEGELVELRGKAFRLNNAPGRRIPIYMSATGPKMLQLAGEVADGVILMAGIAPASLDYGLSNIELGARRAGRALSDLDVAVGTFCHIGDDGRELRLQVRPYVANYAIRHRDALRDAGIAIPEQQSEVGVYPDLVHAEDWQRAIAITSWVPDDVVDDFVEKFCLLGRPEQIVAKVQTLADHGVTNIFLRGVATYDLPTEVCDVLGRDVIPRFA